MARRLPPKLRRRIAQREPKKRFIIYCEGKNTEPAYFRALRRVSKSTLIEIETIGQAGVPRTIAERAIERARSLGLAKRSRKALDYYEKNDEI